MSDMADLIGEKRLMDLMERQRDMRRARRTDDDDQEMRKLSARLRRLNEEQQEIMRRLRRLRARRSDDDDDDGVALDDEDELLDDDDSMEADADAGGYDDDDLYDNPVMRRYRDEAQVNRSPGSDDSETDFEMRRARRATLPKYVVSRTNAPVIGKRLVDAAKREARDEGLNWRSLPDRELAFRLALERA